MNDEKIIFKILGHESMKWILEGEDLILRREKS